MVTQVTVPIALFYAEKRHRPAEIRRRDSGPLAAAVFDLCVEFMLSHLKKNLQADLYTMCLGVVHRLLCYQKKNQIRLRFEWKSLWTALITICSFVVGHEAVLIEQVDIFALSSQVITNLNLFITFGDTFLPDPSSYDELYYELIRVHNTFEGLYNMGACLPAPLLGSCAYLFSDNPCTPTPDVFAPAVALFVRPQPDVTRGDRTVRRQSDWLAI